jgi:hypothetical protein
MESSLKYFQLFCIFATLVHCMQAQTTSTDEAIQELTDAANTVWVLVSGFLVLSKFLVTLKYLILPSL